MAKKKASKKKSRENIKDPQMRLALERHDVVKTKKASWEAGKETTRKLKAGYDTAQKDLDDLLDEIDGGQGVLPLE